MPEETTDVMASDSRPRRSRSRSSQGAGDAAAAWRRWLRMSLGLGAVMGAAWFVLAPGGAVFGDPGDYSTWFPRDASLAALMVVAGVLCAIALLRRGRRFPETWSQAAPTAAVLVCGLAGAVLAWRTGVFAGDLFQTVPDNMALPSIVFSLRSPSALLLWPLASAAVLFVAHFVSHYFRPAVQEPQQEPRQEPRQ